MTTDEETTDAAPQLIETTKLAFAGLNGEYAIDAPFELGELVRYTVTGYVKREGRELIEPKTDSEERRSRPFAQIKITGIRRTS